MDTEKRYVADCRDYPPAKCTLTIAGKESEVLDAAVVHAVAKHGMKQGSELREMIRKSLKEEIPIRA